MARKRLDTPEDGETIETPSEEAKPSKLSAPRLSLQLTGDEAKIDLARMQPGNRAKLAALLRDPDTRAQLGLVEERAVTVDAQLDRAVAAQAVGLLGMLAVMGAKRAGYRDEHAALMAFGQREIDMLAPATMAVLAKYNLLGGKYAEELALAAGVGAVVADKWTTMRAVAEREKAPTAQSIA